MPTPDELEKAFSVYFGEINRCRQAGAYWSLLHVVVALPDICGALESYNGWATEKKYVDWCGRYWCPGGMLSPEDYREIRNIVLHQGRSVTTQRRFYKFTRPTTSGTRVHRYVYGGDVVVLDVGELAAEVIAGIRAWFRDLQSDTARLTNVTTHLPKLVTVKEQELPGISGMMFNATHTSTQ